MLSEDPRLEVLKLASPYKLGTTEDLMRLPEPTMLIENFLPHGAVVGVTAAPGVGKTWLMMELMRSACFSGHNVNPERGLFLGSFRWTKMSRVMFVGSDASIYDYARQWRRIIADSYGDLPTDRDEVQQHVEWVASGRDCIDNRIDFLLQSEFMLDDLNEVCRLIKTVNQRGMGFEERWMELRKDAHWDEEQGEYDVQEYEVERVRTGDVVHGSQVIVFDTLSRLTRANQNDNTEMENVFRNIRFIAEQTGATCILLHHNSKKSEFNGGEDWRGAVAQIGALDCWLQLRPTKNDRYVISAEFKKFRGITPDPFLYRMDVNDNGPAKLSCVENKTGRTVNYDLISQRMYEFISNSPEPVTAEEIHEAIWDSTCDLVDGDRAIHIKKVNERLRHITKKGQSFEGKYLYKLDKESGPREKGRYHWTTEEHGEED